MSVNGREAEEKECSSRLILILFPYRGNLLEVTKKFLLKPIPLKVIIYSKITDKPVRDNAILPTGKLSLNGLIFYTIIL
jgi:hypothetical protein